MTAGRGLGSDPGFFRFLFACLFCGFVGCGGDSWGCFVGSGVGVGSSLVRAGGEGSEESGDNDVTSIEGDSCRIEEAGELGVGESSGTGTGVGGSTKWNTREAIWI